VDHSIFELSFSEHEVTSYRCPSCNKAMLRVKEGTFHSEETKASRDESHALSRHPEWEPEWTKLVYSCLFECTNTACREVVASGGKGFVEESSYADSGGQLGSYEKRYHPTFFLPHLTIFTCPKGTPAKVEEELAKSFAQSFCDPASSLNHVRTAIEHLLTHLKIKRFNRRGKRRPLSLHARIELLPEKYSEIKELLLAAKWLGNAGTHGHQGVTPTDVIDAYVLIEEVLRELYDKKRSHTISLAKKINKKRGPK
jgi:Domain of unknown function (DUF4145)